MNFFSSSAAAPAAPSTGAGGMFNRIILRRNDPPADDIENQPLSPRIDMSPELASQPQMTERRQPRVPNFRRPTVPSMFRFSSSTEATTTTAASTSTGTRWPGASRASRSITHPVPRPSSSHYPDEEDDDDRNGMESPKPNERPYSVNIDLPSTRLHLPGLQRTWTQGSNGPPTARGQEHSIPPVPQVPAAMVTEPMRPMPAAHIRDEADELYGDTDDERARGFADPAETQLAELAEDGRRRRDRSGSNRSGSNRSRRHRHRRAHQRGGGGSGGSGDRHRHRRRRNGGGSSGRRRLRDVEDGDEERSDRPLPKNFLFCFPWIKSRRVRSQILQCFVSGMFLVLMLTVCECQASNSFFCSDWLTLTLQTSPCP